MSVRLKIENSHEGLVATISQRDDTGKVIGLPSVSLVGSKEEAKQRAKTLARSLGLKLMASSTRPAPETNRAPGACQALAIPFEPPKQVSDQVEISQWSISKYEK